MALSKSKQAESEYYARLGAEGIAHTLGKPFSDDSCSQYLANLSALFGLMEAPPRRVVDFGCGTGWLSLCLAQRGYEVLGVDLSREAVDLASAAAAARGLSSARFAVGDYEDFTADAPFDYAVFHDALHHAESEETALRCAHRNLRKGGAAIVIEPGTGHHSAESSQRAIREFGVHEKDMPPKHVVSVGKRVGFERCLILPFPFHHNRHLYRRTYHAIRTERELRHRCFLGALRVLRQFLPNSRSGLVILWK